VLLGQGDRTCPKVGCGTDMPAGRVRALGWPRSASTSPPGSCATARPEPAIVVEPGYLDGHWTTDSWTDQGLRDKVGAAHWPLPALLDMLTGAGLRLDRFAEGGAPTPAVLGVRAVRA
jgi:hypothetical protein